MVFNDPRNPSLRCWELVATPRSMVSFGDEIHRSQGFLKLRSPVWSAVTSQLIASKRAACSICRSGRWDPLGFGIFQPFALPLSTPSGPSPKLQNGWDDCPKCPNQGDFFDLCTSWDLSTSIDTLNHQNMFHVHRKMKILPIFKEKLQIFKKESNISHRCV